MEKVSPFEWSFFIYVLLARILYVSLFAFFLHTQRKNKWSFLAAIIGCMQVFFSSSNGCFCFSSFPSLRVLVLNFDRKTGGRLLQGKAFFEVPIGVKETFLCKFDIFTLICKSAIEIFLLSFPFLNIFLIDYKKILIRAVYFELIGSFWK